MAETLSQAGEPGREGQSRGVGGVLGACQAPDLPDILRDALQGVGEHDGAPSGRDAVDTRQTRGAPREKHAGQIAALEDRVGLDRTGREALLELFDDVHADGATLVVATHELSSVDRAQRLLALREGALVYDGPPDAADLPTLVT